MNHVQLTTVVYEEEEQVQVCAILSRTAEKEVTVIASTQNGNATGRMLIICCCYVITSNMSHFILECRCSCCSQITSSVCISL